jgi:hypothetical protein
MLYYLSRRDGPMSMFEVQKCGAVHEGTGVLSSLLGASQVCKQTSGAGLETREIVSSS